MKGVIIKCLESLVCEKFGKEKWEEIVKRSTIDKFHMFIATEDVKDETALKILDNLCKVLNVSLQQAADAFGDYWVNVFAPKIYPIYFENSKSAKEFLLKMDQVHADSTKSIEGARPPRFEYEWINEKTLIMKYKSHRGLIDIMVGLIKGVGKYYKEELIVRKLDNERVEIIFK